MPKELDSILHNEIVSLCNAADDFVNHQKYDQAIAKYTEAWALLPEPKETWNTASWIRSAIGDAYFFKHDYLLAYEAFSVAVEQLGGLGNPFLHLRIGECQYELGDLTSAADELTRAYMGAGKKIFQSEDPKYFQLLKDLLDPSFGQKDL